MRDDVLLTSPDGTIELSFLRESDDLGEYLNWMRDPAVVRYMCSGGPQTMEQDLIQYISTMRDQGNCLMAIRSVADGRHLGNVNLLAFNKPSRRADLGIVVGVRDRQRSGVGFKALTLLLYYGFSQLGLHRITGGVVADNLASIRLFEKAGFTTEGRSREHFLDADGWHDAVHFGLLEYEAREQDWWTALEESDCIGCR
jgi:Acetyltransferases, including N-acetylases of ribosomal proteins